MIESCRRILAANPDSIPARFELARLLLISGQPGHAVCLLADTLVLEPAASGLWLLTAAGLTMTSQDRRAVLCLQHVLVVDPSSIDAAIMLAQTLMRLDRPDAVEAVFRAALQRMADRPYQAGASLFNEFGCFRLQCGDEAAAGALFERALTLAPDFTPAINNLANACSRLGLITQGLSAYRRALTIAADSTIEGNLASLLLEVGDTVTARRHLTAARKDRPLDANLFDLAAQLALAEQHPDRAIAVYRAGLETTPDHGSGWINLGFALETNRHFDAALTAWRRGLTLTQTGGIASAATDPETTRQTLGLAQAKHDLYSRNPATGTRIITVDRFESLIPHLPETVVLNATDQLLWFDDAVVHHDQWYFLAEGRLFLDMVFSFPNGDSNFARAYGASGQALVKDLPVWDEDDAPAFLLAGATNYYHWLLDYLPRVRWAREGTGQADLPILINYTPTPFQQQSLACLGIDSRRLRTKSRPGLYRHRRLAVPHRSGRAIDEDGIPIWQQPQLDSESLDWLRTAFGGLRSRTPGPRRIMVSRRQAAFRRCLNEETIQRLAERYGFVTIILEDLNFAEQAALFFDCEAVLGVHGAGFANMLFAPQHATLIELHPTPEPPPFFVHLCRARGQRHVAIAGQPVHAVRPMTRHFWNFTVDPAAVAAVLATL